MVSSTDVGFGIIIEMLSFCHLIPVLISFIAWSRWPAQGSLHSTAGVVSRPFRAFVGIFSSNFTIGRLQLLEDSVLNDALFDLTGLDILVVFPRGHGPAPGKLRSVVAPCPTDTQYGLCCRVDWAMRAFLRNKTSWFLRAIDDSWFNPYNMNILIRQLESFVDPWSHVVIKSHDSPVYNEKWNVAYMQGGAPTLMSRAAVQHVLSTFSGVCGDQHWPCDDTTLTLIANRSFQSSAAWGDVRFADAMSRNRKTTFQREWNLHNPTHFQFFDRPCSVKARYLKPLKVMVGAHTRGGVESWRKLVEQVSLSWFPQHLLLEFPGRHNYVMCVNISQATYLASDKYLKATTPLLAIQDPRLNFSLAELWRWGFEHIPQLPWLPSRPYGLGVSHRR
jgi:hypothetical protein